MKIEYLIIVGLAFSLLSCVSEVSEGRQEARNFLPEDTLYVAIIQFDSRDSCCQPTTLSKAELHILDSLITVFVADFEGKLAEDKVGHEKIDLSAKKYYRQYVPSITDGEKKVWANFFCGKPSPNWRTEILSTKDGGNCFFNLTINLTRKSYSFFMVNGEA